MRDGEPTTLRPTVPGSLCVPAAPAALWAAL